MLSISLIILSICQLTIIYEMRFTSITYVFVWCACIIFANSTNLIFYANKNTTSFKGLERSQLQCVGTELCGSYYDQLITSVACSTDQNTTSWKCHSTLDQNVKFGSAWINCEEIDMLDALNVSNVLNASNVLNVSNDLKFISSCGFTYQLISNVNTINIRYIIILMSCGLMCVICASTSTLVFYAHYVKNSVAICRWDSPSYGSSDYHNQSNYNSDDYDSDDYDDYGKYKCTGKCDMCDMCDV
jgi:hypothetical protein